MHIPGNAACRLDQARLDGSSNSKLSRLPFFTHNTSTNDYIRKQYKISLNSFINLKFENSKCQDQHHVQHRHRVLAQVAASVYVTHGHLRTTSDKQQQIREMAGNLIFEQYGMRVSKMWSVRPSRM